MKKTWSWLFCILLFSSSASALTPDSLAPLKETMTRIRQAKFIDFVLEKRVYSEILGKEKTYKGRAFLSGPLFRFETEEPEKSIVVYDGKILWVANYPPKELGGKPQILKGKIKGSQKEQMILTNLLAQGKLLESFEIEKKSEKDGTFSYAGVAKDKKMSLQKVEVEVKKKELKMLSYVDDVGNKTTILVQEQRLQADSRPEKFQFTPPKGAQVQDL